MALHPVDVLLKARLGNGADELGEVGVVAIDGLPGDAELVGATSESVVLAGPNFSTQLSAAATIRRRASSSVRGGLPCQP